MFSLVICTCSASCWYAKCCQPPERAVRPVCRRFLLVIPCCGFPAGLRACRVCNAFGRRRGAPVLGRPTLRLTPSQLRSSAAPHSQHTSCHTCQPGAFNFEGVGSAHRCQASAPMHLTKLSWCLQPQPSTQQALQEAFSNHSGSPALQQMSHLAVYLQDCDDDARKAEMIQARDTDLCAFIVATRVAPCLLGLSLTSISRRPVFRCCSACRRCHSRRSCMQHRT